MISRIPNRRSNLGQSFTTCLLAVVVFFGGIGMFYFKVFQWRNLENPLSDLDIVKKTDSAELAFFRKKTVPDFVDPAIMELGRLITLRKASKRGTVAVEDCSQTCNEIANRLKEIMNSAKLREIPDIYAKEYKQLLIGISEAYRSLRSFEEGVAADIPADKERAITESIKFTKKASSKLDVARKVFYQP